MSKELPENIVLLIKDLIKEISGFQENTQQFNHILKYFTVKLKKSGTTHFVTKRDVDENVDSMCEKFCFHGFPRQAVTLKAAYETYILGALFEPEKINRLSFVKLLLCLSKSPTKYFLEHPKVLYYTQADAQNEEVVDWGAYLNEGIERWNPNFEDSSDEESIGSFGNDIGKDLTVPTDNSSGSLLPVQIKSNEAMCIMNLRTSRDELLATIQHTWYEKEHCFMKPESELREANIGILWEDFVNDQVQGLIPLRPPSVITEYIVIREILWQLWRPHDSKTFELVQGTIRPRPDVTLASVRSFAFYTYLSEFVPYIELLEFFRMFQRSVQKDLFEGNDLVARTYQSYCNSIKIILGPVFRQICNLEDQVRKQESTYTLINLADDLKNIFKPVKVLKKIHDSVIIDHTQKSPCLCAATLIRKLHESLDFAPDKYEQDLKLTLFLESLYIYLNITDSWLMRDDLNDFTGEFVIKKQDGGDERCCQFTINDDVDEEGKSNSILRIFLQRVLEIGKNVNFLRAFGRHDVIDDYQDSMYKDFIETVLRKIQTYNGTLVISQEPNNNGENDQIKEIAESWCETINEPEFIFPVIGDEIPQTNADLQRLDNMIDVSDGFLMAAFEDFFVRKPTERETEGVPTLYERISSATTDLFPKTNFFETVLLEIIEKRFSGTGLLVKNLLVQEHLLEKQFRFLNHLYLLFDDVMYPVYRAIFSQAEASSRYRPNDVWLTSKLQDVFMDLYPEFCSNCSLQMNCSLQYVDSLSACGLISLDSEVPWPLNVIITKNQLEKYNKIFQFLLKLKWALHTLNHMSVSDMGVSSSTSVRNSVKPNLKIPAVARLIRLKFYLINVMNSLQHFVFGLLFAKATLDFQLELKKAYDLDSLIEPHDKFIESLAGTIADLQEKMLGRDENNSVMNCIKLVNLMWNDLKLAKSGLIDCCYKMYQTFYLDINPVIFPTYRYDYL